MNQKRNKIIVIISILLLIIFVIWVVRFYKPQISNKITRSLENYYQDCQVYLREPQTLKNGQNVLPPQVFCKLIDDKVTLLKTDDIEIHPGDFVITIVDTPKLFTQEYFDLKNASFNSQQKIPLPKDKINFCVSYGPYEEESLLTLLPNILQPPKILNKTTLACQEMALQYLSPISVIGTIPQNTQGQPFGLAILIPNNPQDPYNTTYTTLYSGFVNIK